MAVLPWIVLVAYKLRNRNLLLVLSLPPLFLLGSFIKHSFAIHSICILSFLFLEKSRENLNPSDKKIVVVKNLFKIVAPLFAIGIIYIALRHCFIETTETPLRLGQPLFTLPTYLGYSVWGPLMAPWGIGSLADRWAPRIFELNGVRIWSYLGPILSILSPLAIGLYTWLPFRKNPLLRLTGIVALLTALIHFYIYHSGGVIELRDRYYQFPAFLFLAVAATHIYQRGWKMCMARLILGGSILIGSANVVQIGVTSRGWMPKNYKMGISSFIPDAVAQEIYTLSSKSDGCVLAIPAPILEAELSLFRPPSSHFLAMYEDLHQHNSTKVFHGRAPLVLIIYAEVWNYPGESYAARFADYSKDEWERYEVGAWVFLKTKHPLSH